MSDPRSQTSVAEKSASLEGIDEGVEGKDVIQIGFDLGTNSCVVQAILNGEPFAVTPDIIPSVVGYPKEGIIPGIIPGDKKVLLGDEAIKYQIHLRLVRPVAKGFVSEEQPAVDLLEQIRGVIDPTGRREIWACVGAPANADDEEQARIRHVAMAAFSRILVVPEPFLAAMGMRNEERLSDPGYIDPVRNSLIIDIGAGTTDLCIVQGYYPTANEQVRIETAGDDVDARLGEEIRKKFPDVKLSPLKITQVKEQHSYVGEPTSKVLVKIPVRGKMREIDLTSQVGKACEVLIDGIVKNAGEVIARSNPDSVEELLANIVLTGGGSEIRGLAEMIQFRLRREGYDASVRRAEDYKRLVARGALKIARKARDDQWQISF